MKILLVALLLLFPLPALAQTYEWTDKQGDVHFTDDRGKVPKKYRKKVRVLGDDSGQPIISETTEPAKKKATKDEPAAKGKVLYGGRDEASWRNDFKNAKGAIQQTESTISELRGRLTDTSKMSRGEYLSIQATLNHLQSRLDGEQKKLDQLEQSADKAGVPAEFRQ